MFRTVPLSIIRSFSLYTQQWYMSQMFADSLRAGSGRNCSFVLILYDINRCCEYSKKTPNDGQRNCPKHVEFYSKNKFEELVYLVGFIIRRYFIIKYTSNIILKIYAIIKHRPVSSEYKEQNIVKLRIFHFESCQVRLGQVMLGQVRLGQVRLGQVRLSISRHPKKQGVISKQISQKHKFSNNFRN